MANGTLITVYRGYEIRESAQIASGIAMGVNIYHAGEFIGYEKNIAQAKSRIDAELAKAGQKATATVTPAQPEATTALTVEQRKATNLKKMGRFENNPNDLI